ncbi:hypothetical protein O4H66_17350 [Comamonadaceae bacterium G21597-S1]|nr:hypothetical protein [Comamonadaceae bacterium G21597-S1]
MRFRVPNTGAQHAADGIGNFFRSMAMAPLYQAQAAEDARAVQSKLDLQGAQQRQAQAHAALFEGQADTERQQQQRGSLGELIKTAAMMHGVAPSQTADFSQFAQTGQLPAQYRPPAVDGVGPFQPAPKFYQDDTASKIWKSLGLTSQALAVGDKSVENIAKASDVYRDQTLGDQVLAGQIDPGRVAEAQAAMGGKDRFSNIESTGRGFNKFTGAEQSLSPSLSVLFDKKTSAGIGKDNAAAGASNASAGASRALAGLRGVQTNNAKVEGGITALDYEAARAGQPLPSSNKGTSGSSATNSKFRNQIIMAAMRRPEFAMMDPAEKQDFINTELMVAGMDPVVPGELAGVSGKGKVAAKSESGPIDANAGTKKPAIDMDAANKVKADFKAGRITREQAKAKLKALGMD